MIHIFEVLLKIISSWSIPTKLAFPIIYVPRDPIWEQILTSLVGVLVGSGLTWFLTKKIEDGKSNRSFVLERQQSVYLPLLGKIDDVASISNDNVIAINGLGVFKEHTPDITTDEKWLCLINIIMEETKPRQEINYTRKQYKHVMKIRQLFELYMDQLNERTGQLTDLMFDLVAAAATEFQRASSGDFEYRFMRMHLNPQYFYNQLLGIYDKDVSFLDSIEYLHKDSAVYKEYKLSAYKNNIYDGYKVKDIEDVNDLEIVKLMAWITSEIRRGVPIYKKINEILRSPLVTEQGENYCKTKEQLQKEFRKLYINLKRDIKKEADKLKKLVYI